MAWADYLLGMSSKQLVEQINQTHFINNLCHYAEMIDILYFDL
ncbi:hypothetical protein RintRC_3247 [Richelia intracellularis]|nr:hypothetical protein RintRC_3247 [Richelia intracellularis]